jgi:hypothetical protein
VTKNHNRLYCFSPPIMIATFVIEMSLFVYTLVRYKLTAVTRLVAAALLLLALFQLSEYNVCEGMGLSALVWSRIGFVAITLLPPLGLHLVYVLAGRQKRWLVWLNYAAALAFVGAFAFSRAAFQNHVCAGNYVIFHLADNVGSAYFAYYYGFLIIGIVTSLAFSLRAKLRVRQALILQAVGYLSFLLPTTLVNTINPTTTAGIPSIMCGFAIIYAIILALGIAPLATKPIKAKKR